MIQVPAILTGLSTKVDNGVSLRFATNELSATDTLELLKYKGQFGFLLFKENEFKGADIPQEDAEDKTKTPSKRLRAVLYVMSQQRGIPNTKFEEFYREKMEMLIEMVKTKLD